MKFVDLADRFLELIVAADDRRRPRHHVAQLLVDQIRILIAGSLEQAVVPLLLSGDGGIEQRRRHIGMSAALIGGVVDDRGADEQAAEDAGQQRVGAQAVGAVVLIVALADGVQARDVRQLVLRRAGQQAAVGRFA